MIETNFVVKKLATLQIHQMKINQIQNSNF